MEHPGATVLQVIGGLMAAATVTPLVMGLGVLSPSMIAIFVLGLVLLYAGSRMRRDDGGTARAGAARQDEQADRDAGRSRGRTDADVNRDPAGTPTSPGVDEQDEIHGM